MTYCILKIDTSGLSSQSNAILKIIALVVNEDTLEKIDSFTTMVKPWEGAEIQQEALDFNGIQEKDWVNASTEYQAIILFNSWLLKHEVTSYLGFNIHFPVSFLASAYLRTKQHPVGMGEYRELKDIVNYVEGTGYYRLSSVKQYFNIPSEEADCESILKIFKLINRK